MTGEDALLTTAEIGVAFAGFASVVTAFRRREDGGWSAPDAVRFQLMITASLSAALFALLPFALRLLGAGDGTTWALASVFLALYLGVLVAPVARRALRLTSARALSPAVTWSFLAGAFLSIGLQVSNVLAVGFQREPGPYFLGLLYLLILSGVSFARLLPIGRAAGERESR